MSLDTKLLSLDKLRITISLEMKDTIESSIPSDFERNCIEGHGAFCAALRVVTC